jgi:hypothetical protein
MIAVECPPIASRKTMKRACVPESRGTEASLASVSERIASPANRPTASASTVMMSASEGRASAEISTASTAGKPCDSFTSWIAAAAVGPAGFASGIRSQVASPTSAAIEVASSSGDSRRAIGVRASSPSASARRAVTMRCGVRGAQSATKAVKRSVSSPSTGSARSVSFFAVMRTGRRPWNSARPRLTPT